MFKDDLMDSPNNGQSPVMIVPQISQGPRNIRNRGGCHQPSKESTQHDCLEILRSSYTNKEDSKDKVGWKNRQLPSIQF
jgi:hypothetical protein